MITFCSSSFSLFFSLHTCSSTTAVHWLPSPSLQNYLRNCGNLEKFVVRVGQNYFPKVVKEWEEGRSSRGEGRREQVEQGGRGEVEAWPNKRRNQVIAGEEHNPIDAWITKHQGAWPPRPCWATPTRAAS